MKNLNEEMIVEEIVKERVIENKELFNKKELNFIQNNSKLIKKVYLIGLVNGRNIWK